MTDAELLDLVDRMSGQMISVATGGPQIKKEDAAYKSNFRQLDDELRDRLVKNPVPYESLWDWYGKWSADLPSYQSRRRYIGELTRPLKEQIRAGRTEIAEPTGWSRVDRALDKARGQLAAGRVEEDLQQVGLLCRETLISVAQEIYDPTVHKSADGIKISSTDFKRMIEAYLATTLYGSGNDELRRHTRSALDLTLHLQHQRSANFRLAASCVEATASTVNIIAIISGRRDPNWEQPS